MKCLKQVHRKSVDNDREDEPVRINSAEKHIKINKLSEKLGLLLFFLIS